MHHALSAGHPVFLLLAIILALPIVVVRWSRRRAFQFEGPERATEWLRGRRQVHIAILVMVGAWWALWDLEGVSGSVRTWATSPDFSARLAISAVFLLPPVAAVVLARLIAYFSNRTFLGDRWNTTDLARLTLWSAAAPTAQLLLAAGFEDVYRGSWLAAAWLVAAAVLLAVGTVSLRRAEGLTMRTVKSGEVYKRAFALAKQMKTPLREVAVVPPGRGNLTNAWGSVSRTIAITENYSTFLRGAQLDFVIGHELGHVKSQHGLKKLGIMAGVFAVLILGSALLPRSLFALRPLLDLIVVFAPVLLHRFISRRFEYAADRAGLALTHNSEMAKHALGNLHRISQVPITCGWVTELLMTHPSLDRRVQELEKLDKSRKTSPV